MKDVRPDILIEYQRWANIIGEDSYTPINRVGIFDVLRAHFLLLDYFAQEGTEVGGVGPRSLDLLHSAIDRQNVGYAGKRKWTDELDLCATLFFGLIKNHPFYDCNKRTALLTAFYYLQDIKRIPITKQKEFERLTLQVADNKLYENLSFKQICKNGRCRNSFYF
ncbi:MAG TPA: Fic family protein [Pyrinomonadaceae bacterium]|jgi:death-on-curing protein|nr:Fic family protein [Pyrinomonadaceae bacterium]